MNPSFHDKEFILQRYRERIEKLSQQDRLSKFCTDAGFPTTVEVGQYFMTEDTEEFSQFTDSVAFREYTLPRDGDTSEPKGWIRGNTQIGPVLEGTTCCMQGKYGVEIRIKSVNKDHSHSWVRISHGLNKLVTNLNKDQDDNEQETSEMQFEEYALKSNAGNFASRSKAKAKPQRRDSASPSTRTISFGERTWTDVQPGEYSISDYEVSKKLIHLLRHGSLPREDGQEEEETRKDFSIVLILQEKLFTSELFKDIQDAILLILHYRTMLLIPNDCVEYIYHIGCAINSHSMTNSGLIPRRTTFWQEKTDGILSACESYG